jgi:hypothetical protein
MKVKEHGTWLSVVGFFQLIAMASFGFAVNESQKQEINLWLASTSLALAVVFFILMLRIYSMIFKKVKKPKK